jgi:small-conductance mechanosensitive channel
MSSSNFASPEPSTISTMPAPITRELACRCMELCGSWVIAMAFAGMFGFLASALAISCRWIGIHAYLAFTSVSLSTFFTGLAISHFGDPLELARLRQQRERELEQHTRRAGTRPGTRS